MRRAGAGLLGLILSSAVFAQSGSSTNQSAAAIGRTIDVYDGFESATLSDLWDTSRFAPGAVQMQSEVVRAGRGAAKITVRSRDMFEAGEGGDADSERDELMEARSLVSKENLVFEYSFSLFFPKDFPIVPTRLVIAQWKQYCPGVEASGGPCTNDSPVLALRYIGGELRITQDIDRKLVMLFREKGEFRGRWLDFRVKARFTPSGKGRVKAWLNGKQLVDFTGVTADQENAATGYPNPSYFYFKMGLYRNVMAEPMTVYIDEYRKRQLAAGEF
jgi:hypothetical protein